MWRNWILLANYAAQWLSYIVSVIKNDFFSVKAAVSGTARVGKYPILLYFELKQSKTSEANLLLRKPKPTKQIYSSSTFSLFPRSC